ncbi:hypothetical protein AAE115_002052 [Salmonella enterica]|nr:hypothetical protein [Salmonella enterica subsp. diarizonae]EFO7858652.1 hypothetical protein [Salmonella enterica]EFV1989637.1 hypothetical protein [Salmonella enterica]EGA3814844.1 hypothetical protein [Salmonella enterica]EIX6716145.1 hypothetical protein [Salmonella enterica]
MLERPKNISELDTAKTKIFMKTFGFKYLVHSTMADKLCFIQKNNSICHDLWPEVDH